MYQTNQHLDKLTKKTTYLKQTLPASTAPSPRSSLFFVRSATSLTSESAPNSIAASSRVENVGPAGKPAEAAGRSAKPHPKFCKKWCDPRQEVNAFKIYSNYCATRRNTHEMINSKYLVLLDVCDWRGLQWPNAFNKRKPSSWNWDRTNLPVSIIVLGSLSSLHAQQTLSCTAFNRNIISIRLLPCESSPQLTNKSRNILGHMMSAWFDAYTYL